jgi:hypothetical protein
LATKNIWPQQKKIKREAFYVGNDPIEIIHEFKYLGIDFYSHGNFKSSIKRRRIADMKALMGISRKDAIFAITCWELKSHLFKTLVLPSFTYGTRI